MSYRTSHHLEQRLLEWAEWFTRNQEVSLGYLSTSSLFAWQENTAVTSRAEGSRILPTHSRAEEIEACVVQLFQHNAKMAQVLRTHYLLHGNTRKKASLLRLSHSSFCAHLALAKEWLAGRLSR